VAPSLAHLTEAQLAERLDCLLPGADGQPIRHALSSRVVMIGGSISAGRGSSSK
jgi:hypothetical protein